MILVWGFLLLLVLIVVALVAFTARTAARVVAAVPPRGQFIEVNGQKIHYVDRGTGPAIVMIHGLGGNLLNFDYALADRLLADHRVILIDRPGSGYSVRPESAPANLPAQAATIAAVIKQLGLSRPLVVGHSLGGAVALTLALEHPDSVGGLVLLAALTHAKEEVPPVFRGLAIPWPLLRKIVAWTVATPLAIRNRDVVLGVVFGPDPVPADFALRGGGVLGLRPVAFYNTSTDLLAINDDLPALTQRYGALAVPVAMLYGRGDRLLDYREQGEALKAKLPTLDLELIEGGHMLQFMHPEICEAVIRRTEARMHP
ncbi:alpha/beta fold hydrolase [Bradyrhizobium sp. WD16]|uniref:alpha/beta fold hydrolase n=1 Tax=Bradyrhizobium sp. WD16 TaxID=1521768 RepID=UPI0020A34CE5|nr:alpha/beta hydrolase [Bradyrhizobium sp. WD16]UTD28190.1 alpha/beta hydrolase [Bradyrhizobium sp. WD16]